LKHGDTVFEGLSSSTIAEALAAGNGRVECLVLPHSYRHLSPLAADERTASAEVEKGAARVATSLAGPQRPFLTADHADEGVGLW
jgi:hypothetical protein